MGIYFPGTISKEDLWRETCQLQIKLQIRERKWRWLGHILRKPETTVEKRALDWNLKKARRKGRRQLREKRRS